jgi:hypothetical protein
MKKYSFNSVKEPTEKQLKTLMLAVLEDVKERAVAAEVKYRKLQANSLIEARAVRLQKLKSSEIK